MGIVYGFMLWWSLMFVQKIVFHPPVNHPQYQQTKNITSLQFKKAINLELKAAGYKKEQLINKVTETGVNTTLIFKMNVSEELKQWLNKRFSNGITVTDTDHAVVFINTPNQLYSIQNK